MVQKNCSFFVLSSELPGQQPAHPQWRVAVFAEQEQGGHPFPGHPCQPHCAMCLPRAPHPCLAGVAPQTFQLRLCSCCSWCLLSQPPWISGLSSKSLGEDTSTHTSLHEHSRAVPVPWLQREPHAVLLSASMTGKFL